MLHAVAAIAVSLSAADRVPNTDAATRLGAGEASLTLARRLGVGTNEGRTALADAKGALIEALDRSPTLARAAVVLGEVLLETGEHAEADARLTRALTLSPTDLDLMHLLGVHRFRLGDAGAVRGAPLLESVAAAAPKRFDVTYLLAGYYYRTGNDDRALRFARLYLDVRPKDAYMHGLVGNLHLRATRTQEAIAEFDTVLSLDPSNLPVRVNLGNVLFGLRDYARAVELYEAVLATKPTLAPVLYNLASAYFALERFAPAAKTFGSYSAVETNDARGFYFGGVAAAKVGDRKGALVRLRRATELAPKDPWAPYAVADLARQEHDLAIAEAYVAMALARKDDSGAIMRLGGLIARDRGDLGTAVRRLVTAQTLDPKNAALRAELGQVRFLAGDEDLGIDDLEAALVIDPKEKRVRAWLPVARTRRAARAWNAGRDVDAEADLLRALEVRGGLGAAAWNLAWLYDMRGDSPSAIRVVRQAIAIAPLDPDLHLLLAYLNARIGRWDDAESALARSGGAADAGLRWLVQGALHGAFGEFSAAIAAFEQARSAGLEVSRAVAEARLDHAAAQLSSGRPEDALATLAQLGTVTPEDGRARAGLELVARLAMPGREGWEAVDGLVTTLESGPAPDGRGLNAVLADARLIRGYAAYRLGDMASSADLLQSLVAVRPSDEVLRSVLVGVLLELAEEHYAGRRYDAATISLERARELAPDDAYVRHGDACLAYVRGEREPASVAFEALASRGLPTEAALNLGLYLADVRHDAVGAAARFRTYLTTGGIARAVARGRIERFERVFGP